MTQELFRGYNRETGVAKCALKIDLHKAYDSINCDFLMHALSIMAFPSRFKAWIFACISTVRYSVKMNGSLQGYFKGEKGHRQGDPMSSYLFTVVMNVHSCMLNDKPPGYKHH